MAVGSASILTVVTLLPIAASAARNLSMHANHVPAAGVLGVDPGYLGPIRDDARARDGHSSAHFALSLMRPIIIASILPSTVAMQ